MSYGYRTRVRRTTFLWDNLTEAERQNPLDWCPVSDELMREQKPGLDIDKEIAKMSDAEFASFHAAVMRRYRARKARRQSTINYLRQEGRTAQADELEKEQQKEDAEIQEVSAQ